MPVLLFAHTQLCDLIPLSFTYRRTSTFQSDRAFCPPASPSFKGYVKFQGLPRLPRPFPHTAFATALPSFFPRLSFSKFIDGGLKRLSYTNQHLHHLHSGRKHMHVLPYGCPDALGLGLSRYTWVLFFSAVDPSHVCTFTTANKACPFLA